MSAEQNAHKTADKISETLHETVDKAEHTANKVADELSEKKERIAETQDRIANECRQFVRDKPLTALAIAAGIGYFISRVTR